MGMGVLDEHAEQIVVSPSQLATAWLELEQQMAVFALAVAHVDGTGAWGDDGSVSMLAFMFFSPLLLFHEKRPDHLFVRGEMAPERFPRT